MLRTIGDTVAYILALPKKRRGLAHWEEVRRLIVKEAAVATVTQQVHHALSKDKKLDGFAFESITSARRWRGAHKLEENENEIRSNGIRCCWGFSGSTLVLAETPVSPAEAEKIKATIEGFGCTGGKIEKADFGYEVDDVKCKDGQEYEIKLDPNFKLIVMTRD